MNKLVLAFATVAAFGLSTAAFAENPAVSTSIASTQNQAAPSHRAGAKKVVRHHTLYESVGHSQPRGRRADCISGVCIRARPGARRQGQMDRKDSHYTCGQGRALAERPWNLGPTGPAREGPSVRHQGT